MTFYLTILFFPQLDQSMFCIEIQLTELVKRRKCIQQHDKHGNFSCFKEQFEMIEN